MIRKVNGMHVVANKINHYFVNVGAGLAEKIPCHGVKNNTRSFRAQVKLWLGYFEYASSH